MLETILEDYCSSAACSNEPIFDPKTDYRAISDQYRAVSQSFGKLSEQERSGTSLEQYLLRNGAQNPKDEALIPARNYYLLENESQRRISDGTNIRQMPIDSMDFDSSLRELTESLENRNQIREIYRFRKRTSGQGRQDGISAEEAQKLRHCFAQGRELYTAGLNGSLLVKPLNFFYALTAYAYGIIVLNNPLRFNKGMLPGSHAMNYLPGDVRIQFGGDVARGTFSDLITSFPTHEIVGRSCEFLIDTTDSIVNFYECKHTVSIGLLLSLLPEMSEFYSLATGRPSRAHALDVTNENDRRNVVLQFKIGNGERRPALEVVEAAFPGHKIKEAYGRYVVDVPADKAHEVKAMIFTDARGVLWFIDNPFGKIRLPEICVHFLISSIYSNVMRYRPDEWGALINNDVDSQISLLSRHYFSVLERKFNSLILRNASAYFPYVIE